MSVKRIALRSRHQVSSIKREYTHLKYGTKRESTYDYPCSHVHSDNHHERRRLVYDKYILLLKTIESPAALP